MVPYFSHTQTSYSSSFAPDRSDVSGSFTSEAGRKRHRRVLRNGVNSADSSRRSLNLNVVPTPTSGPRYTDLRLIVGTFLPLPLALVIGGGSD